MLILFESLTQQQADTCALVLSSSGLSYRLNKDKTGWVVWVKEAHYYYARQAMDNYFYENKSNSYPIYEKASAFNASMIISGMIAALLLLVFHIAVNLSGNADDVVSRFGSSAFMILNGEFYRTVTALMLHADEVHLVGNMVSIVIFGTAVCSVSGWGCGWLMILLCGAFGNLLNALMYKTGHISIGASTAVFGAIGILVGYQSLKSQRVSKRHAVAWVPIACGFALLGILGSGEGRVDIMAHLFGLVCGIVMGFSYAKAVKRPPGNIPQIISGMAVFAIIAVSWSIGY